jgi:hypothetical protein
MNVLIVSPIPSHPVDQGNSARIHSIGSALQSLGHVVHFFYYAMEGLSDASRAQMAAAWEYLHTMPASVDTTSRSLGDFYGLDDWYDARVGEAVRNLHKQFGFDVVLANYVWFSGVLDALPDSVLKVIDTHDVFGDRHLRFIERGMPPEWYFTTPAEERRGLARAHVVIAIQDVEARYFARLMRGTRAKVKTIGFLAPSRKLPPRSKVGFTKPVLGYLGSSNPFNIASITAFAAEVMANRAIRDRCRFLLAGSICRVLQVLEPFELFGPVDGSVDFYSNVDCVLNPMQGGTGLKIKTLEAISFGKSVAGTSDAFTGVEVRRATGGVASRRLESLLSAREGSWIVLSEADARLTYSHYREQQIAGFLDAFRGASVSR